MKPNHEQFLYRLAQQAKEELDEGQKGWWYLSFADDTVGFIGGILVEAQGPVTARLRVGSLGLAPGGEMLAFEHPSDLPLPEPVFRNRLLTVKELEIAFADQGAVCAT